MNTTTTRRLSLSLFVAALGFAAAPRLSAAAPDWTWKEKVAAGRLLEIRNVNGGISAQAASGPEVEVTVQKKPRRGNPDDVKIEVVRHAGGVTICAVYPTPAGSAANECKPGGGRMNIPDGYEVTVAFEVKVPAGLRFQGRTVNGGITASALSGDTDLATVNGSIQSASAGQVRAKTVNGSVTAKMGRTDWQGDLDLETVNGSVRVDLPASASTEVKGSTVNGSIESDFGLEVRGRFGPKKVSGTIGAGGRMLNLKAVNGSIQLRRS